MTSTLTCATSSDDVGRLDAVPDPADAAAFCSWLGKRYMLNDRDKMFSAALAEIVATTPDGIPTATPMRFDLVNETRGVLVYGETGSGKTALIRRSLRNNQHIGLWDGGSTGRAFAIRVPPEATLKGLATEIAKQTGYHVAQRLRTTEVWEIALHRLTQRGITILWIDEAHHMLGGKESVEVRQRLKSLMQGDKAMALIVSGIPQLEANIRQDRETDRRFLARVALRPMQSENERETLRNFLQRCCVFAGLTLPKDHHLIERLEAVTYSSLGGSIELFQKAVYRALRRRDGQLTLEDFRHVYDLRRGSHSLGPFDSEYWPDLKARLEASGWAP